MYAGIAGGAFLGIISLLFFNRPSRRSAGKRGRLPKQLELSELPLGEIPEDAQEPLEYLSQKLKSLHFEAADLPVRIPAMETFGYRVLLIPFYNADESTFFLMGIEAGLHPQSQLMLHILTPLQDRRVETSTLEPLASLIRPPDVEVQVVVDADSVDEIWSRHRRALTNFQRADRLAAKPEQWRRYAGQAYEAWLQSAVRSQRLQLDKSGELYRIRSRPKSMI